MEPDEEVNEAEITLDDEKSEQREEIDSQETDSHEIDGEDEDSTESSPKEKVVFSEAQQKVFNAEIGKKTFKLRETERKNEELLRSVNELQQKVNVVPDIQVPPMPDAFSMTDADYRQAMRQRDEAIVTKANLDARQLANDTYYRNVQAQQFAEEKRVTQEATSNYVQKAAKLGISQTELQQAGSTLMTFGVSDELAGFIVDHDQGPQIAKYLEENTTELEKVAQMRPSNASVYIATKIAGKVQRDAKSNINQAPDPIDTLTPTGKRQKAGGPKGATFE
jgi:hypothetical protein|tara:strand:+ start:46 stop:882 length:837 start_codon:yes stop_codon:yes gene_type:complete